MSIEVRIVDGSVPAAAPGCSRQGAGAVLCFEGLVRPLEDDRPITALEYEVYQPMAEDLLQELCRRIVEQHGLIGICVEHSRGRVPTGRCSFRLTVSASHREPALAAVGEFIDRLKEKIPIWKKPVFVLD